MRIGDWGPAQLALAAVALVIGLGIGGLGPRAEVRDLRARLTELEARPCEEGQGRMARLFGGSWPTRAPSESADTPTAPSDDVAVDGPAQPEPPDPAPPEGTAPGSDDGATAPNVDPERSGTEEMLDLLDVRRAQAVAALRQQAGATDEQMDDMDGIIDEMNANLGALADELVALSSGRQPSRTEMMGLAADALDVLLETEASMSSVLSEEQLAELEDDVLDPTAFVDGSVIQRFAELDR